MERFSSGEIQSRSLEDNTKLWRASKFSSLDELRVDTRVNFPSAKLSLNISSLTRRRIVQWFTLLFQLNGQTDLDLVLEDSQRKCLHSIFLPLDNVLLS